MLDVSRDKRRYYRVGGAKVRHPGRAGRQVHAMSPPTEGAIVKLDDRKRHMAKQNFCLGLYEIDNHPPTLPSPDNQ
ncbi:hypothetical protein J6590_046099 [Homalodisca vitripennis]|nr:hypothetical protein J6590_046099 [Homalodisca vitripennis]